MITTEKTSPQVLATINTFRKTLNPPRRENESVFLKVREMRKDPTVAIARWLTVASVMECEWSVLAEPNAPVGAKEFIDRQIQPWRNTLISQGFMGCIDFGWQPFEIIHYIEPDTLMTAIWKIKPLLQDLSYIRVDERHGDFIGLYQPLTYYTKEEIYLNRYESLVLNFDVEGTNWYGSSIMDIVESAYNRWISCDQGADRFDRKVAGAHWIIHYPPGTNEIDGVEMSNFQIAKRIISRLEASGSVAVPNTISRVIDDLNNTQGQTAWKIELLSAQSSQSQFIDRMKYLDALKVRAFGMPERAMLEGQFGTKAEADSHLDVGLTLQDWRHKQILFNVNEYLVNNLMALNYGERYYDTIKIVAAPLNEKALGFLRSLYTMLMSSETMLLNEFDNLDLVALRDRLNIPTRSPLGIEQ